MIRLDAGRPRLQLIEGGVVPDAEVATAHPSQFSKSGALSDASTPAPAPESPCDPTEKPSKGEVRVLVCGSRTWRDHLPIWLTLAGIKAVHGPVRVCHGGAQGADTYAEEVAAALDLDTTVYLAQWELHGKAAGPIRNKRMLENFKPHLVLAFSEHPLTKGTKHMIGIASATNVPVYIIGHAPD